MLQQQSLNFDKCWPNIYSILPVLRRKYELKHFLKTDHDTMSCPFPCPAAPSNGTSSTCSSSPAPEKKVIEKNSSHRGHGLGHAFRNSWRHSESKSNKKSNSMVILPYFIQCDSYIPINGTCIS